MSTTQATLLTDLIVEYGFGVAGTATSATTTTVVDAANFQHGSGGQFPNESPIAITSGAGVNGRSFKTQIDPSNGTITFAPAIAGNTGTPTYVISNVVNKIERLTEAINRGLTRRITRWLKIALTDIPDGDFMGTTASDHWTTSNATQAYTLLSMVNGFIQRVLQVTTSAGNGYTQSDNIPVVPGETRNFQVFMRAVNASNTVNLLIRDITNNAAITPTFSFGAATTTSRGFVTVKGSYSVPSGCSLIAYRLAGVESGAVVQFGMLVDNGVNQHTFPTQPHLTGGEGDVGGFYIYRQGGTSVSGPSDGFFEGISDDGVSYSDYGWGQGIEWDTNPGFPIFYDEFFFFPALTSDTDATDAPEEVVLLAAAIEVYMMLSEQSGSSPTFYRGKPLPTAVQLKLQQCMERWHSPRIQRLLADRRVTIRRTYSRPVTA